MDEIERALAALDARTAGTARPAIESLIGPAGDRVPLSTLTQLDLQHFLWHDLPSKWFTEDNEHHEIAWAVGDLLEAAGIGRYAAICRDQRTHEILSAWHADPEEGGRLGLAAQQASGVVPPDTEVITFGEIMGPEEARTHARVSRVLEDAIVRDDLDPAARGFKNQSAQLVGSFLRTPSLECDGNEPLTVVRRERTALWAHRLNPRATPFWSAALLKLEAAPAIPANVELSLAPASAFLERLVDGVTLTDAGYLPPKLAISLDEQFGWTEIFTFDPRGEADIPALQFLHEHLRAQRLITKRGKRLTPSAEGKRCLADPERLWRAVVAPGPRWRPGFEEDALAVMAASLIRIESRDTDQLRDEMSSLLSAKWQPTDGGSLDDGVAWVELEWYRLGTVLGWWEEERWRSSLKLSSFGEAAAASVFWSVAAQPPRMSA